MATKNENRFDVFGNITYGDVSKENIKCFIYPNYSQFGQNEKKPPLAIETIGITNPDPNYFIERKHSDYFIVECIVSGKGYVIVNDKKYTVEAGDVYLLLPGSKHKYYADKQDPFKKIWINFFSDVFLDIIKAYDLQDTTVFKNVQLEYLFNELIMISKTSPYSEDVYHEIGIILFRIITALSQSCKLKINISPLANSVKVRLDNSIYDKVTVEEVADELHVSKAQLIREFKKYYNVTPYNYLLTKKLEMAKRMLVLTGMSVCEISESLSFADEHYFSNMFKKKTKTSPLKYRKQNR